MARSFESVTEDYSPFEDDYRGFDLRDGEDGQRGPLILALAAGILMIFGAIVWNTYRTGFRTGAGVPVVSAPGEPYKVAHGSVEETGDIIDEASIIGSEFAGLDRVAVTPAELLAGGPPKDLRRGLDEIDASSETGAEEEDDDAEERPTASTSTIENILTSREAAGRAVPPTTALGPEPTLIPDEVSITQGRWPVVEDGGFLVQVGAFRTEAAANRAWTVLQTEQAGLLSNTGSDIQRADLGANGVFYRLRANSFQTRSDAVGFCDALKTSGQSCIVVTR